MTDGDFCDMEQRLKDAFSHNNSGNNNSNWTPLQWTVQLIIMCGLIIYCANEIFKVWK